MVDEDMFAIRSQRRPLLTRRIYARLLELRGEWLSKQQTTTDVRSRNYPRPIYGGGGDAVDVRHDDTGQLSCGRDTCNTDASARD